MRISILGSLRALPAFIDEGHAVPALVLDVGDERAEGGAPAALGDGRVLLVRGLGAVEGAAVLADDDVLGLDGGHGAEDADLLVADVLGGEGDGALHGDEGEDLQQVVLHDVADDAELVKVAAAALGAEGLLEDDLDVVDVVAVPGGAEERVAEPQDQQVLDHLLAQVVVDAVQLVLGPVGLEAALERAGALEVLAEGLLDDDAADALGGVAAALQALRNLGEDAGGQRHVEEAVGLGLALLQLLHVLGQVDEALVVGVLARDVGAQAAEVVELLLDLLGGRLYVGPDAPEVLLVVHFRARITDDLDVIGEELVAVL